MKLNTGILLIFFIWISGYGFAQQKPAVRFLKRADKTLGRLQSLTYTATYDYKGPADNDTISFNGQISYSLNPRDIFFGYDILFENKSYFDAYYSLGKSYILIHKDKKIYPKRFLDPRKTIVKNGPFLNNPAENIFDEYFKNKNYLSELLNDKSLIFRKTKAKICADTIRITAEYITQNTEFLPDTLRDLKIEFFFNRKTKLPLIIQRTGISNKGSYFSRISFSYQSINQDSVHDFFIGYQLPDDYEIVEPKTKKNHGNKDKIIKIPAPDFSLTDASGNPVNLADLNGKVVLLDFWYSSCAPCIKASHYLEKYTQTYCDSGLVILGMNPIDGINKINQHNKKWGVTYPVS